ncbi:MAG: MBOAT family protein, partial [Gemmiger sp.]|nr:MBOAT family protein [Gemmiger sp.]
MVFNSVVFLFCFMPLALGIYYLAPARTKNAVLLGESLIFYCWTGVRWLPLILTLVAVGYLGGLAIQRMPQGRGRKAVLIAAIAVSTAALVLCKYTNFLIETLNAIASLKLAELSFLDVLPLGISY